MWVGHVSGWHAIGEYRCQCHRKYKVQFDLCPSECPYAFDLSFVPDVCFVLPCLAPDMFYCVLNTAFRKHFSCAKVHTAAASSRSGSTLHVVS